MEPLLLGNPAELCATNCLLAQPAPTCSHITLFPKDKCKRMEKTYNISLRAKGGCSLYWQLCTWRDRQITRVPKCMWFPPFINGPRGSWERRSFVHFHLDLPNHETSWPPCSQMYLNQAWLVNSSDKVETLKRHLAIPTPLTRISNANKSISICPQLRHFFQIKSIYLIFIYVYSRIRL